MANVVLLSEIPTTYDKRTERQVNAGNLLLRGVPGVGKTFFGVILAAISDAKFARIQGRADLQPTEVVGFQMINPATGQLVTEFGPMASAEVILLDEINRIPLKSQSAFLEGLQDRTITVGKDTYDLPAFSFAIATMNPVELGQGTFPLSEAATDRFAAMVQIGYLPAAEEEKLVDFDFKRMTLRPLLSKQRIIDLRGVIGERVFLHKSLGRYVQRLVGATRPMDADTDWHQRSPSDLVERGVDLGASPRAIICWSRLAKTWALLRRRPRRGLPRRHPGAGAVRARPPHLAGAACRRARPDHRPGHRRRRRRGADPMTHAPAATALVDLNEIAKIELLVLRRLAGGVTGDHRSRADGTGFDFTGLRDWQAGDRFAAIDWAQSSLTNFAPLVVREFDQPSTATVLAVADASLSTRCGAGGTPLAAVVARAVATIGLSATFFQDRFGLLTFDRGFAASPAWRRAPAAATSSTAWKPTSRDAGSSRSPRGLSVSAAWPAACGRPPLVAVVSDFLFDDALDVVRELALVNVTHDVFLVLVDSAWAFAMPADRRPVGSPCTTSRAASRGSSRAAPTLELATQAAGLAGPGRSRRP